MKMPLQPLPEPDAHEKKPAGWDAYFQSYSKDQVQAIQRQAYEDGLRDAQALEQAYMKAHSALELIATPKRPDGTWNRDREACRDVAAKTLAQLRQDFNFEVSGLAPQKGDK
jgi:hypothetical protein